MSIASEIARLQEAKEDIKDAIEAKGVTVPSSAKIDDYADLIGQISGGGGGGGSANLTTLNVTPTTSAQQITPTSPVDGYDEVNVAAVTSAIDANITAANIKKGVTILGVTGTNEGEFDFVYKIKKGEQTTLSAQESTILDTIPSSTQYRFGSLFRHTGITSADLSPITNMGRYGGDYMFANSSLQTVNLSGLTDSDAGGMNNMFNSCRSLASLSLPKLTKLEASQNLCDGCTSLVSFSAPKLATVTGGVGAALRNCNVLQSVTIHPNALNNSGVTNNILGYATTTTLTTLRLSQMATDNVYLSWQGNLDSDSILDVLNHLSTEATGKTCAFKNLTVASNDTNYAAISAKKAALTNWNITGLNFITTIVNEDEPDYE